MKTGVLTRLFLAALCLLLLVSGALGETRESVIWLEGQEEPIEETLFESPLGFSFWYDADRLEAWHGEKDLMDGVVVEGLYLDDFVILSMIPEEDAVEYVDDLDMDIVAESAGSRVQQDIYWELEDGRYYFLTVIAEGGQYLRAVGEYAQESAEGNGKFLQRLLDSITFTPGCAIRADWGEEEPDEEDRVEVILTAAEPVTDVTLLALEWDDFNVAWEKAEVLGSLSANQSVSVMAAFIGDMPNNGLLYTDAAGDVHIFALDISGEDGSLILWDLEEAE